MAGRRGQHTCCQLRVATSIFGFGVYFSARGCDYSVITVTQKVVLLQYMLVLVLNKWVTPPGGFRPSLEESTGDRVPEQQPVATILKELLARCWKSRRKNCVGIP